MPNVIEAPSEEEAYLYAILQDRSGIDIAEWSWVDEEAPDNCFRAWPFQWPWWRDRSPLQIDQCARSVGKSMGIRLRAFAFPFCFPGQEMVITAPEGNHLDAITDVVETQFTHTRLGSEMLIQGRTGVKHRPFHMNFANGSRIMGRIPQRDGKGVKGIHPIILEQDEAQDYPGPGWVELVETLKRGQEGAVWRAHGVTRGVRDHFYKYSNDPNWKVHRVTAMHRPTWSEQERIEKINQYQGRDDPDYRRNVLGLHGDQMSPLFVLHRLMMCADDELESDYNTDEYFHIDFSDSYLRQLDTDVVTILDFPMSHLKGKRTFWVGMDVGYTQHPSEILVFAEEQVHGTERTKLKKRSKACPDEKTTRLKLLSRISMTRVDHASQVAAILHIIDFYKPKAFAMDKTGLGLPLFQDIQERSKQAATVIKGYGFSEKRIVSVDETVEIYDDDKSVFEQAGIKKNVLEAASDSLRDLVDNQRLWLPWDTDLIGEFQGQTFKIAKSALDMYGRKIYSVGKFHALDAARMAALGWSQFAIEELIEAERRPEVEPPVFDSFVLL